jgi:uncharacterized protein YheU (UPF0270 family)
MKLSKSVEVILVPEDDSPPGRHSEDREDGVAIPFERIDPDTLRNLISEFVTREWEEVGDTEHTLDDKISQVVRQLQEGKAKVVFDLKSGTCNIVRVG